MKKLITLLLFLCLTLPLFGFTLKGSVTYTVEQARKEAFANVEYTLPKHIINANRTDPNYKQNQSLIKNGVKETGDRYITYYSDGGYGIVYKNDLYKEYYFKKNGKIESIGIRTNLTYPVKSFKYDYNGNLEEVVLYITENDGYIFKPNGQMVVHWVNNVAYDINGKIIMRSY